MPDSTHNARLTELSDLIEKERDSDKFANLIAELNALLDEQKKLQIANRIAVTLVLHSDRSRDRGDESE